MGHYYRRREILTVGCSVCMRVSKLIFPDFDGAILLVGANEKIYKQAGLIFLKIKSLLFLFCALSLSSIKNIFQTIKEIRPETHQSQRNTAED